MHKTALYVQFHSLHRKTTLLQRASCFGERPFWFRIQIVQQCILCTSPSFVVIEVQQLRRRRQVLSGTDRALSVLLPKYSKNSINVSLSVRVDARVVKSADVFSGAIENTPEPSAKFHFHLKRAFANRLPTCSCVTHV